MVIFNEITITLMFLDNMYCILLVKISMDLLYRAYQPLQISDLLLLTPKDIVTTPIFLLIFKKWAFKIKTR